MSTVTNKQAEVIQMPEPYERLVKKGREAREQADNYQWTEGDLALDVEALHPTDRPRDPETGAYLATEEHALKRYAEDIDIKYGTLKEYRTTAAAWPPARRLAGASFDTHRTLNDQDDRFDLIRDDMTRREARAIVQQRNAASTGKPGWFELAGAVADRLIAANKDMVKLETALELEVKPAPCWERVIATESFEEKATRYAAMAHDLEKRFKAVAKVDES